MGIPMNLRYVRGFNDAIVLTRLRCVDQAERAELAAGTGLTPQAVSKILARLIDDGLVEEVGRRQGARGKPATLYRLRTEKAHAIGIHAGRTDIKGVRVDLGGNVLDTAATPMPARFTPAQLIDGIASTVEKLVSPQSDSTNPEIVGVGVALPGPVDRTTGVVQGFRWWRDPAATPLLDALTHRLGRHTVMDLSINAALELTAWQRGDQMTDTLYALLDRGVGGALWIGGRLHRGAHMSAGEFGHLVIEAGGPECECGRRGCVEAVQQRALAEGDIARAAAAVATGIANALHIVDVPGVVWSGSDLEAHPEAYAAALAAELQRTLAGGAAYTIHRAVPAEVPHEDCPADLVATGAAVMVLESVYGIPARPGESLDQSLTPEPAEITSR